MSESGIYKVDRCLARYSPRAEANNAIPCNTVRYNTIPCNTIQYNAMTCKTMQYHKIQSISMHYHTMPWNTMESIKIRFSGHFWAKNGLLQPPWSLLSNMSNIINDKTYMFETDSGVNLLFFLIIDNCYRDMILFHKLFCYWHWWSWWRIWRWLSSWLEVNHSSDLSEWFQLE